MKVFTFLCSAALSVATFAEAPFIDRESLTFSQGFSSLAKIRYRLTGSPAIITVDIQTNVNGKATNNDSGWISIGEANFRNVAGDVNKLISPSDSKDKVITWNVGEIMPEFKMRDGSCRAVVKAWTTDAPPDYMVVDLRRDQNRSSEDPRVRYYVSTNAFPEADNVQNNVYRTDFMAMRLIKARGKTFRMGTPSSTDKEVPHNVTFSEPDFYMAVYPLTIGQTLNIGNWFDGDPYGIRDIQLDNRYGYDYTLYQHHNIVGEVNSNYVAVIVNDWKRSRGESVAWPADGHSVDDLSVCGQLRNRTGVEFDLPTEAQWEYCCRAGTTGSRYDADTDSIAWHRDNSKFEGEEWPHANEVGKLRPNAWGLYDMLGSVWECCQDYYTANLGTEPVIDPIGPSEGTLRVVRGCSYDYDANYARCAFRDGINNVFSQKAGVRLIAPVGLVWPTKQDNRMLTAEYSLDRDTIVTVDVQTNRTGVATADESDWVSIGDEYLTDVFGDVNCRVPAGDGKKVYWRADEVWPGQIFDNGAIRLVVKKWDDTNPPDYLVIDLRANGIRGSTGSRERYYTSAAALPYGGITNRIYKYELMAMRRIPAQGVKWCMGSPETEEHRWGNGYETQHYVTFEKEDFYCAVYPVTCGQLALMTGKALADWNWSWWSEFYDKDAIAYTPTPQRGWDAIRGSQGTDWPTDGHFVTADSYLGKLSTLVGRDFDLPTDAQWEYLCRAGTGTAFYCSDSISGTTDYAWFQQNSDNKAHEVGLKKGNAWGIYDLIGCLWELVLDWYGPFTADEATDPIGPVSGSSRVWRGGNGAYGVEYGRSAARYDGSLNYCCGLSGQFRPITPISGRWPNGGRVLPEENNQEN